jgi:SAM-dependent methyltransferase
MRGFARGGSYERLAARATGRTLDLACGDRRLGDIGIDRAPGAATVLGDAHALPFAAASFDTVTCHLAFMLFAEPARVVAELARVLAPGGSFLAVLGGGPTAEGGDALAWFASRHGGHARPALLTEARWAALFAGWRTAPWERWLLELSGDLEAVAATLAAAANAPFDDAAALRAAFPTDPIPCRAVTWFAAARL